MFEKQSLLFFRTDINNSIDFYRIKIGQAQSLTILTEREISKHGFSYHFKAILNIKYILLNIVIKYYMQNIYYYNYSIDNFIGTMNYYIIYNNLGGR